MYCKKCGSEIADYATFCPNCGASTSPTNDYSEPYSQPAEAPRKQGSNGCAIA